MKNRSSVLAVLLVAIVLIQLSSNASGKIKTPVDYRDYASHSESCRQEGATAGLCVENLLEDSNDVTLLNPPGCCNYCTGEICPAVCEPCKSAVLEKFKPATLEADVGPYPLESLTVQVNGKELFCLAEEENLQRLTATAFLQVGPDVGCARPWRPSISGWIWDEAAVLGHRPPFEICLRWCERDCSTCAR